MRFGLGQFTLQRPPWDSRSSADIYADVIEFAARADALGLDSFWLAEHHGADDGYNPSLLPLLAAIAARTERIELGTAVMLAPFHNPVRLAEDAAVVDLISNGRLALGLGLGWAEHEYRMFGVDSKGRGKRLEEIVEILRLAWTRDRFSLDGRFYSLDDVAVTPKPARIPPIFLGGAVPDALERAARLGDGHFPPSVAGLPSAVERAREILALREKSGSRGPYRFGMFVALGIGSDPDDGWRRIRDGVLHVRGSYGLWAQGMRDVSGAREFAAQAEEVIRESSLCGTPEQIVEQLAPVAAEIDAMGFEDTFFSAIIAPPGVTKDDAAEPLEIYAKSIAAALR